MTSNSHAEGGRSAAAIVAFALCCCVAAPTAAQDTPMPAREGALLVEPSREHLELRSQRLTIGAAEARQISPQDRVVLRYLDAAGRAALRSPVLVTVRLATPLDTTPRDAAPVVIIDGRPLYDSFFDASEPGRLIGIVRDGRRLRTARVQVGWLGDLEKTMSEQVTVSVAR